MTGDLTMPTRTHRHLLLASVVVLWTILGCTCSPCAWLLASDVNAPSRSLDVTEDAASSFEEKLKGAWEDQGKDQFRLQFTDEELTSYVNMRLQDAGTIPLTDPRVWLTRGKMYVGGKLTMPDLPLSGQAVIVASASLLDEKVQISFEQASIGRIPIPSALLSSIEDTVNGALSQAQLSLRILQLEILEGEAIIIAAPG
jgi:hypothetical protein